MDKGFRVGPGPRIPELSQGMRFQRKTNISNADGLRNPDDLFSQIFTKIQHDKDTFIHFSTIKHQVSLRRQDEGSLFCEALSNGNYPHI